MVGWDRMVSMALPTAASKRSADRGLRSWYQPRARSYSASASGWIVTSTTLATFHTLTHTVADDGPRTQLDRA